MLELLTALVWWPLSVINGILAPSQERADAWRRNTWASVVEPMPPRNDFLWPQGPKGR